MRRWGWVVVLWACAFAGCTPLTARQAQRHESGAPIARGPDATAMPRPAVEALVTEAHTLPDSQRVIVETALGALNASAEFVDCSGFVQQVYARAGIVLPRTVAKQIQRGRRVAAGELCPGDLVFFAFGGRSADHVGIYVGRGAVVHVSSAARGVQVAALDSAAFASAWAGARRVVTRTRADES